MRTNIHVSMYVRMHELISVCMNAYKNIHSYPNTQTNFRIQARIVGGRGGEKRQKGVPG